MRQVLASVEEAAVAAVPTQVRFGAGALEGLAASCRELSVGRPLLVTGKSSARGTGLLDRLEKLLRHEGISPLVAPGVASEPSSDDVDRLARLVSESAADALIAAGGGSVIDAAKAAGMVRRNGGACTDYEAGRPIERAGRPVIALPTTAGSGSEVTPYAVITNAGTKRKFTLTSPELFPRLAIVDPLLTLGLPPGPTLASGLDAFVHALEAYLSRRPSAEVDPWALEAIALATRNLESALERPREIIQRSAMAEAALLGGCIIAKVRTGLIHTLSVALSACVDLPHGLLNAVICPHVLRFNAGAYGPRLRRVAGIVSGAHDDPASDEEATLRIGAFLERLSVPKGLPRFEVASDALPGLVARVKQDQGLPLVNVRPFDEEDLARLFQEVLAA